jgi:rhomboid protease GluP
MSILVPFLILAGVALYLMTPQERQRLLRAVLTAIRRVVSASVERTPDTDLFLDALRAQTRWPIVTLAILAINIGIFGCLLVEPGAAGNPDTLIAWGASFGPRTTNGEWWRVATAVFVHSGFLHLLATTAGLVPLGLILERLVGPVAFATVYMAAGILGTFVSLSESALAVTAGASGAVFGLLGLTIACVVWGVAGRAPLRVPLTVVKRIAAATAISVLYSLLSADLSTAGEVMGFTTGLVGGLALVRGVGRYKPPARRVAVGVAATLIMAVASAIPLRGTADVRPVLERVVLAEERTAAAYEAKVVEFRKGWISAEALAGTIDRSILPQLQTEHTRLKAVRGVPREYRTEVATAADYLQRRQDAWRRRADGLRKSSIRLLRDADRADRIALEAFRQLEEPADPAAR